ncbi:MAG: hypothetical protein KKD74_12580, partial [Bacteroidetes bacterium]|nr:hypothetical protein [Bacteroidota bacterium]
SRLFLLQAFKELYSFVFPISPASSCCLNWGCKINPFFLSSKLIFEKISEKISILFKGLYYRYSFTERFLSDPVLNGVPTVISLFRPLKNVGFHPAYCCKYVFG